MVLCNGVREAGVFNSIKTWQRRVVLIGILIWAAILTIVIDAVNKLIKLIYWSKK